MKRCFSEVLTIINGRNQKEVEDVNGQFPIYGSGGIMGYANQSLCPAETVIIGRKGSINNPLFSSQPFWNVDTAFGLVPDRSVLLPKYLYYFCKKFDFLKLNTTVTIPSLTKANLLNIEIEVPNLSVQENRINKLGMIDRVLETNSELLGQLDNLVKSRFIEMFGLPGTDPKGLGLETLDHLCTINPKKNKDSRLEDEKLKASFIPMSSVSEDGLITNAEIKTVGELKKGFTYFEDNDVSFAKITPCMENGKGAVVHNLENGIGFGSTEFHVLRPKENCNSTWLYTLLSFPKFRTDAARHMTGSAGQRRVPAQYLASYRTVIPAITQQNQFAQFAERTAKSKLAIQKSIDELEILKKSLMQEYFG